MLPTTNIILEPNIINTITIRVVPKLGIAIPDAGTILKQLKRDLSGFFEVLSVTKAFLFKSDYVLAFKPIRKLYYNSIKSSILGEIEELGYTATIIDFKSGTAIAPATSLVTDIGKSVGSALKLVTDPIKEPLTNIKWIMLLSLSAVGLYYAAPFIRGAKILKRKK